MSDEQSVAPAIHERKGHTPGPWLRIDGPDYAEINAAFRPSSPSVALVGKAEDADLIASAPELLVHLKFAVSLLGPLCGGTAQVEAMRAAITKAEAGS